MRNVKLTVAYDGTNYHGFQEQRGSGLATIQEELERCLTKLAKRNIQVIGAGRTDAGVHARGQVVNFDASSWSIPVERLPLAMNGLLPRDISVCKAEEVSPDFHARFSALAKTYQYTVYNSRIPSPFYRLYSFFEPRTLKVEAMREAAGYLVGKKDFASFRAVGTPVKTTVRTIHGAEVIRDGPVISFVFRGDGFLYNMVRIMVGTLLEVGLGKSLPEYVNEVIKAVNRTLAGPTVPPQGLCLEEVEYPQSNQQP